MDGAANHPAPDPACDNAVKVLSHDTTYVFDADEARVPVLLIDEAFQPTDGAGGGAGGPRDYLGAHSEFRTSVATLLGTTVDELDLRGTTDQWSRRARSRPLPRAGA